MKDMIYTPDRKQEVLHSGIYEGHRFAILNLGTHPTAYVECKIANCNEYDDERLYNVGVHGGFTYYGEAYWDNHDKNNFLGWDYGHFGDYAGYYARYSFGDSNEYKRWTTSEIYDEVKSVIEQLIVLERGEASNDNT